jgi:glycosyltransferase involved in cell wall biosynthesis
MANTLRLGCVSSYVPKKCGIATFSRDLLEGIKDNDKNVKLFVAAAENTSATYEYNDLVITTLKSAKPKSYTRASVKLNSLHLNAVLLQHEFGLFGGQFTSYVKDGMGYSYPTGKYILELLDGLSAPLITTFHTVISEPDPVRKAVIKKIAKQSVAIVTMTEDSKAILQRDYNIAANKISIIPHGTPKLIHRSRTAILKELSLKKDNFYMVMSGLLGPNKGVDLAIRAMPNILKKNPNVRLVVIGQTHPDIFASLGKAYITSLTDLAKKLNVAHAVSFVDKYVKTSELSKYLAITDIYLTPHRDPEQAASGTLAYAIGNGLITISTPYRYAQELLANKRGFLVPFEDYNAIAKTVNRLISRPYLRKRTKALLKPYGQTMSWEAVGQSYLKLINKFSA